MNKSKDWALYIFWRVCAYFLSVIVEPIKWVADKIETYAIKHVRSARQECQTRAEEAKERLNNA